MNETLIHSPEWRDAVERFRHKHGFRPGTEPEVEAWLSVLGPETFLRLIREAYADFRREARFPARLLNYFASCVLSDHSGGTYPHSVPADLVPPVGGSIADDESSYYAICFEPLAPVPSGSRWVQVRPPLPITILWPNHAQYLRETQAVMQERLAKVLQGMPRQFRRQHLHLDWSIFERVVYELDGDQYEAPAIYGPAVADRPIAEVLHLPPETPAIPTSCPVPLPNFPPGFKFVIGLPHHRGNDGVVHSGARLNHWQDAKVELDPTAGREEEELFLKVRDVIGWLWANRKFLWRLGGRPMNPRPAPGTGFRERVEALYRQLIASERRTPSIQRREKLRKKAIDQARNEFPPDRHERLERNWWFLIEEEQPWRQRHQPNNS